MKIQIAVATLCSLFGLACVCVGQRCVPATSNTLEATRTGYSRITIVERVPVPSIRGGVVDPSGKPAEGALVEVFDRPNWIKQGVFSPPDDRKRIVGCTVGKDGSFQILGLPKGTYELRVSKEMPINIHYIFVTIDPSKKRRSLKIQLELGD